MDLRSSILVTEWLQCAAQWNKTGFVQHRNTETESTGADTNWRSSCLTIRQLPGFSTATSPVIFFSGRLDRPIVFRLCFRDLISSKIRSAGFSHDPCVTRKSSHYGFTLMADQKARFLPLSREMPQ